MTDAECEREGDSHECVVHHRYIGVCAGRFWRELQQEKQENAELRRQVDDTRGTLNAIRRCL